MSNIINNGPMMKGLSTGSYLDSVKQISDTVANATTKLSQRSKHSSLADLHASGKFIDVCRAQDELQQQESLVSQLNDAKNTMKKTDSHLSNIMKKLKSVLTPLADVINKPTDANTRSILEGLTDGVLDTVCKDINSINDSFGLDTCDITSKSNIEDGEPTANYMKTGYTPQIVTTSSASKTDIGVDFSNPVFQKIIASLHKIKEANGNEDAYKEAHKSLDEGIKEFDSKIRSPHILSYQHIGKEIENLKKQNTELKKEITRAVVITEISDYAPLIQEVFQLCQMYSMVTSLSANMQKHGMQGIMTLMGR